MDYLLEEVLQQQPEANKNFLFSTLILDCLCGPLCEAITLSGKGSGQKIPLVPAAVLVPPKLSRLDHYKDWKLL